MKGLKRLSTMFLVMALMLSLASAVTMGASAKGMIRLKKDDFSLTVGQTAKIVVKNVPKGATVTFRAFEKSIATVSKKGVIKARGEGVASFIIKVKKKGKVLKKLFCMASVKPAPYEPVVNPKFTGDKDAKLDEAFVSQVRDFSLGLFNNCGAKDIAEGNNVLISPQSVLTDMMMATNGASTTTLAELENVMCGSVGFTDFRKSLSDMNARLIYSDQVRYHIANSIWIRDDGDRIKVKPEFIEAGETWFDADSYCLPFDAAMVKQVNDWVNKHTLGMIPTLMNDVPPEGDVMHLINALAFEGAWADPYQDFQVSKNQDFTNAKGEKEKVSMLMDTGHSYLSDEKAVGFSRPYKGFDYSFVAILPNEGVSVTDYMKTLDGNAFRSFLNSGKNGYIVHTRLPEFSYDYSTTLDDGLKAMGIREAFQEDADFSGMAETESGALYIGRVVHKTHIELDKNGTKAAAVTDIAMADATSAEPDPTKEISINLDRPFLYAIVQNDTGIPVFIGAVNSVAK